MLVARLGVCRQRARNTLEDFALTYFPYLGLKQQVQRQLYRLPNTTTL